MDQNPLKIFEINQSPNGLILKLTKTISRMKENLSLFILIKTSGNGAVPFSQTISSNIFDKYSQHPKSELVSFSDIQLLDHFQTVFSKPNIQNTNIFFNSLDRFIYANILYSS